MNIFTKRFGQKFKTFNCRRQSIGNLRWCTISILLTIRTLTKYAYTSVNGRKTTVTTTREKIFVKPTNPKSKTKFKVQL